MSNRKNMQDSTYEFTKGKLCKQIRKQLGLTQTELAVLLDVSKNAVNDWENDKYEPNDTHWKIITALQDLQIDKDEETQLAFLRNKKLCPDCQKRMEEYIHRFYEILRKNMDSHDEK